MAKIDPTVSAILKQYKIDPKEALWDCHGTWVMLHRFVELAGAKAGITIQCFEEIETNSGEGIAVLKVTATKGEQNVITYGEASPKNSKNAYPYAMAEKRAVDRAILKLIGLHGFVYSEEEADDFRRKEGWHREGYDSWFEQSKEELENMDDYVKLQEWWIKNNKYINKLKPAQRDTLEGIKDELKQTLAEYTDDNLKEAEL
jgi:hypothetical protein